MYAYTAYSMSAQASSSKPAHQRANSRGRKVQTVAEDPNEMVPPLLLTGLLDLTEIIARYTNAQELDHSYQAR